MWECVSICVLVNSTVCVYYKLSHGKINLHYIPWVFTDGKCFPVCVWIGATDPTATNGSTLKEILSY